MRKTHSGVQLHLSFALTGSQHAQTHATFASLTISICVFTLMQRLPSPSVSIWSFSPAVNLLWLLCSDTACPTVVVTIVVSPKG